MQTVVPAEDFGRRSTAVGHSSDSHCNSRCTARAEGAAAATPKPAVVELTKGPAELEQTIVQTADASLAPKPVLANAVTAKPAGTPRVAHRNKLVPRKLPSHLSKREWRIPKQRWTVLRHKIIHPKRLLLRSYDRNRVRRPATVRPPNIVRPSRICRIASVVIRSSTNWDVAVWALSI